MQAPKYICQFLSITGLAFFLARVFNKISRMFQLIAVKMRSYDIQQKNVIESTQYDMVLASDEAYYAEQYWTVIEPTLSMSPKDAVCLDLGCGQGRFSYKLSMQFPKGNVIACDFSPAAIDSAIAGAKLRKIDNIAFHCRSIDQQLALHQQNSFDVIMMSEVTFYYPDWSTHKHELIRLLRPDGVLIISFRSQYFDALCLVRDNLFDSAEMLLHNRKGRIFPTLLAEFSWQTSAEVITFFKEHGLELVALQGIGVCSGIPGDPHDLIARPSLLDDKQRSELMKLELEIGKTVPDAGRYILAVGIMRKEN